MKHFAIVLITLSLVFGFGCRKRRTDNLPAPPAIEIEEECGPDGCPIDGHLVEEPIV